MQLATLENVEIVEMFDERPFKSKMGKKGRVCKALIRDETGDMILTLWNDEIDQFDEGDVVTITNGYVSEFNGDLQISAGQDGKIEKVTKEK